MEDRLRITLAMEAAETWSAVVDFGMHELVAP
jgi:hypothetical protein